MKKRNFFSASYHFILLISLIAARINAQPARSSKEIRTSQADLVIQGSNTDNFGVGFWSLDLNGDNVRDFAVLEGIYPLKQFPIRFLHVFNGKNLENKSLLDAKEAAFKIFLNTPFSSYTPDDKGFEIGDFNGDGCDDILIAEANTARGKFEAELILGNKSCFDSSIEEKKSKGPQTLHLFKKDLSRVNLSLVEISSSNSLDFSLFPPRIGVSFLDINGDKKDDLIFISAIAPSEKPKMFENRTEGKIYILFGKENLPEEVDLNRDSNITLVGNSKEAQLGTLSLFRSDKRCLVAGVTQLFFIPDISGITGQHIITQLSPIIHFNGWMNDISFEDVNNDQIRDILAYTPYVSEEIDEYKYFKKYDPARYQKYKNNGRYPLVTILYGREQPWESGRPLDDSADVIIYSKISPSTKRIGFLWGGDLNQDGKSDAIFQEVKGKPDLILYHFVYDVLNRGKIPVLEEIVDYSISLPKEIVFSDFWLTNLNGNEQKDFIFADSFWSAPSVKVSDKPRKECGRILVYFDKMIDKTFLPQLTENADLIICGEQGKENFGGYYRLGDVDRDGLQDLIVLSPFRDYVQGGLKENDTGAVYIFLGSSLWKKAQES